MKSLFFSSQLSLGQQWWMCSSKAHITDLFELWIMRFLFLRVNSAASSEVGHFSCLPKILFSSITVKESLQGVISLKLKSFKLKQSNFLALPSAHRIFSQPALILHPCLPKLFGCSAHLMQKAVQNLFLCLQAHYFIPALLRASYLSIFQADQQLPCLLHFLEDFLGLDSQVTEHLINLSCSYRQRTLIWLHHSLRHLKLQGQQSFYLPWQSIGNIPEETGKKYLNSFFKISSFLAHFLNAF